MTDWRKLAIVLFLVAGAARAEELACKAMLAGTRALVDATLTGLFDEELLRLVKLGLPGHLTVQATVVRTRTFWFGRVVTATTRELPLTWSEERAAFELDGRPLRDVRHVPLERLALNVGEPGNYEVEVEAKLVVVTTGSLGRVAGFLSSESDSPLARTLLSAIANDLTRSAAAKCPVR